MLQTAIDWISTNKEWALSGIGVTVVTAIGGLIWRTLSRRDEPSATHFQSQRSGWFSTNVQIASIDNGKGESVDPK